MYIILSYKVKPIYLVEICSFCDLNQILKYCNAELLFPFNVFHILICISLFKLLKGLCLDYDIQCIIHNSLLYIIPKFDKYAVYVFSFIVNQNFNKKTKHFLLNTQIHGDISQKVTHLLINIICVKTAINLVSHSVL